MACAGVAKIRTRINCPQILCVVQPGSKQPTYADLSHEQWVQGVLLCFLEELERSRRIKCYGIILCLWKMLLN